MGIEKFHTWLKNTYYTSIMDYDNGSYEHIYVDLNFLLHRLVSYVSSENELLERMKKSLSTIVTNNRPLKSLTLAADGSATYAKIMLQKKRRTQTAQSLMAKQTNDDSSAKLSSLLLTPGTEFMNKFNTMIKNYAHNLKEILSSNVNINLDLSDNPDESEFKICRYLRKNSTNICDTHLIISNDADIILIAMAQMNTYNVYILIQLTQGNTYVISIDALNEQHMETYGYNLYKRLDFVVAGRSAAKANGISGIAFQIRP